MLECAFRIAVDPVFPPPDWAFKKGLEQVAENKFSLIFDDTIEGEALQILYDRHQNTSPLYKIDSNHINSNNKQLDDLSIEDDEEEDEDEYEAAG